MANNHSNNNEKTFKNIYQLFNDAQKRLEKDTGVSICMPNCGKCCEKNQICVTGMEVQQIAGWVRKQKPVFQDRIMKLCEDWLLEPVEQFQVKAGIGTYLLKPEGIDRLMSELQYLESNTRCPLLDENKRCLIYPVRPLICRAFGVTRVAGITICKRPIGKNEFGDFRAYADGYWRNKIGAEIERLEETLIVKGILPTLLLMELNPQCLFNHIYHNDIASAKMSLTDTTRDYLFQEDLENFMDREKEVALLCNPIPRAPEEKEGELKREEPVTV